MRGGVLACGGRDPAVALQLRLAADQGRVYALEGDRGEAAERVGEGVVGGGDGLGEVEEGVFAEKGVGDDGEGPCSDGGGKGLVAVLFVGAIVIDPECITGV
jgi:hypothetical protein